MIRYLFAFIMLVHGLIHFMGFGKAFHYGNITQLTKDISRPIGIAWIVTAVVFIIAVIMFLIKKDAWPFIAIAAVIISQFLIMSSWNDAKFGSIANGLTLLAAILTILKILEW